MPYVMLDVENLDQLRYEITAMLDSAKNINSKLNNKWPTAKSSITRTLNQMDLLLLKMDDIHFCMETTMSNISPVEFPNESKPKHQDNSFKESSSEALAKKMVWKFKTPEAIKDDIESKIKLLDSEYLEEKTQDSNECLIQDDYVLKPEKKAYDFISSRVEEIFVIKAKNLELEQFIDYLNDWAVVIGEVEDKRYVKLYDANLPEDSKYSEEELTYQRVQQIVGEPRWIFFDPNPKNFPSNELQAQIAFVIKPKQSSDSTKKKSRWT